MNQLVAEMKSDLTAAMKSGDALTRDTLRLILGEIRTAETSGKTQKEFTEPETIQLLKREVKRRATFVEEYGSSHKDRADREFAEITVIEKYIPAQLDEAELHLIVQEVIDTVGKDNFGAVMKAVTGRTAGKADGKHVSELVRAAIQDR